MLKILYAASNSDSAKLQLARFSHAMRGRPFVIKVAAYKKSSPTGLNIDWTLDCLQNMFRPDHITLDNDNFITYLDQVKYYNPDLIISDMEYYSSEIAISLGITLWQVSSSLINFALTQEYKYNLGVFKKYAFLLNRNPIHTQRMLNIQINSNCNFVYSHLGDCVTPPPLKSDYEWIRPYHLVGKNYKPCQHNVVGAMLGSNKLLLCELQRHQDVVCFTDLINESFTNIILKEIHNQEEYYCNIKNSEIFFCSGQASFLADAFYNNRFAITINPDAEDIPMCAISEKLKLSSSHAETCTDIVTNINPNIQFLHERIIEL